jgi:hypothetical protein
VDTEIDTQINGSQIQIPKEPNKSINERRGIVGRKTLNTFYFGLIFDIFSFSVDMK